jgi:glycosyltransferase involved in cell wall biosynthesis
VRDILPAVSVIVPCYNLGAYLEEAVDSVHAQTYQDFEIIIVNDGSTDPDTNRLLTGYRKAKTRVIQSDNRGLSAARNLGIEHSMGRYLCALDADDKLAPTFLEKTIKRLEEDAATVFVSCWLQNFGAEDWVWKQHHCDLQTLLFECTVATPSLVRKAAVLEVGGFDSHMPAQGYEDWDLWVSLVERGYQGVIIPEVLFYYRRRPGSMSETCCHGEVHLSLMRYMIAKHESSYRKHLVELLIKKESVSAGLLKTTYELERDLGALLSTIELRRAELARLKARLGTIQEKEEIKARLARMEEETAAARARVDALTAAATEVLHRSGLQAASARCRLKGRSERVAE